MLVQYVFSPSYLVGSNYEPGRIGSIDAVDAREDAAAVSPGTSYPEFAGVYLEGVHVPPGLQT